MEWVAATGTSMEPTLRAGDLLKIARDRALRVGEIAVFLEGKRLVGHRVVSVAGRWIEAVGDNQRGPPARVPSEAVLGLVAEVRRQDGSGRRFDGLGSRLSGLAWARLPHLSRALALARRLAVSLPRFIPSYSPPHLLRLHLPGGRSLRARSPSASAAEPSRRGGVKKMGSSDACRVCQSPVSVRGQ